MTHKAKYSRLLAASTVCVLGSLAIPAAAEAGDSVIRLAASDSYWCQVFPKFCSDDGTPGGTQNVPDGPEGTTRGLSPAEPEADSAPAAAPTTSSEQPAADPSATEPAKE